VTHNILVLDSTKANVHSWTANSRTLETEFYSVVITKFAWILILQKKNAFIPIGKLNRSAFDPLGTLE